MSLTKWFLCCFLCGCGGYFLNSATSSSYDISKINSPVLNAPVQTGADLKSVSTPNGSPIDCEKHSIVRQQVALDPNSSIDAEIKRLNRDLQETKSQLQAAKRELALAEIKQKFTAEKDSSSLFRQIEDKFEVEPVDLEWAPRRENELSNLFIENDKLAEIAVKNMECRSDQCKIVLAATHLEDANKHFESLFQALGDSGGYVSLVASPDVQQNMTTLYVSREGRDFEFK
ncbi:hypothetical protein [Cellvibrio sp. pealriver]|uniref:hypothetical protein n=1 Tax=Cellvibrio sp. pealriver TaxID=1622269 RepID=UPI00066FEC41|nr:hypothetical protein [Cellvibrio sp. pealriver]